MAVGVSADEWGKSARHYCPSLKFLIDIESGHTLTAVIQSLRSGRERLRHSFLTLGWLHFAATRRLSANTRRNMGEFGIAQFAIETTRLGCCIYIRFSALARASDLSLAHYIRLLHLGGGWPVFNHFRIGKVCCLIWKANLFEGRGSQETRLNSNHRLSYRGRLSKFSLYHHNLPNTTPIIVRRTCILISVIALLILPSLH